MLKAKPKRKSKADPNTKLKVGLKDKKLTSKIKTKKRDSKILDGRCPIGHHWVTEHTLHLPPSKNHPEGSITIRHTHCARNPDRKSNGLLTAQEIRKIAAGRFSKVKKKPCPITLKFPNGTKFDSLIAGWVEYWNEVFSPADPLDPNLVKALIASESGFEPSNPKQSKNPKSARGLMQLLELSRKILGDRKGELKNNFIMVSREELDDPNFSISTGIRWLFHKKRLVSGKLGREATWDEAVAEYKSLTKELRAGQKQATDLFDRFKKYSKQLVACKKSSNCVKFFPQISIEPFQQIMRYR
jgi:hypothetical protein